MQRLFFRNRIRNYVRNLSVVELTLVLPVVAITYSALAVWLVLRKRPESAWVAIRVVAWDWWQDWDIREGPVYEWT